MTKKPLKTRRKPGRPTRAKILQAAIDALGIDPSAVDPRRVLAAIAVDAKAPATARVQAAKALMLSTPAPPAADDAPAEPAMPQRDIPHDELSRRALALMGRRPH